MMPHKHTFSGSMNHDHRCDALDEWSADPRSPIKLVENPSRYELVLHLRNRLEMVFCPFCGGELAGRAHAPRSEASCDHLKKLSRETPSSVVYRPDRKEYWLAGLSSLMVRLFYCPFCGVRLPTFENEGRFFIKRSQKEVAELRRRASDIASIPQALQRLGPPDVDQGPWSEDFYPKGERTRVGSRRSLFYENLGKTVTVAVIEWLDGTVDVKFYPKEKPLRRRNSS